MVNSLVARLREVIPASILDYIGRAPASSEPLSVRLEKQASQQAGFAGLPHKNYEGHAYARLALDVAEAHDAIAWRPIETAPHDAEVLAWYPKHPLDDDGNPTDQTNGGAHAIVRRHSGGGWEEPQWLDASGDWFGDDFCWAAEPTHWKPLGDGPTKDGAHG